VITGDVGSAKPWPCARRSASSIAPRITSSSLPTPPLASDGPYVTSCVRLGPTPRGFIAELVAQTTALLAAEEQER
jgi:hypothetical protein